MMSRSEIAKTMVDEFSRRGVHFAVQGMPGALDEWSRDSAAWDSDLDLWVASESAQIAEQILQDLGAVLIARTRDPAWLNHDNYVSLSTSGPCLIDLTVGALMVGPVRLCHEQMVATNRDVFGAQLAGAARVVDLVLRPIFRQRRPVDDRLDAGRAAWESLAEAERVAFRRSMVEVGGQAFARDVVRVLEGQSVSRRLLWRAWIRLVMTAVVAPGALRAGFRHRSALSLISARRPLGRRVSGTLVTLIGTDGTGKTTLAERVGAMLDSMSFDSYYRYFGRARGNLFGVATARKGIAALSKSTRAIKQRSTLRWLASWYYAFEYPIRYWFGVFPRLILGRVVILDRYAYDLWIMPGGSPTAARFVSALMPRPHVLALLDADPVTIRARKQERTPAEITQSQETLRRVLARYGGKCATLHLFTDRPTDDVAWEIAGEAVAAAHRRHNLPHPG